MTENSPANRMFFPLRFEFVLFLALAVGVGTLLTDGFAKADPGDTLRPRQEDLPLFEQPNRSSAVVRRLRMSDRLLEFRRVGGWVRVATHGVVGWGWVPADEIIKENEDIEQPGQLNPGSESSTSGKPADTDSVRFPLRLDVDGSPAMEFRGECRLVAHDDREVWWKFTDTVPTEYMLEAAAAACRIDKKDAFGRLSVRLVRGDHDIAWATTAAPFNWVHVRSRGPWGSRGASRGHTALILPTKRR